MILNELKVLIKNGLVTLICFVPVAQSERFEVIIILEREQKKLMIGADRITEISKTYSSIDRAVSSMKSLGYTGNFEIRFNR